MKKIKSITFIWPPICISYEEHLSFPMIAAYLKKKKYIIINF